MRGNPGAFYSASPAMRTLSACCAAVDFVLSRIRQFERLARCRSAMFSATAIDLCTLAGEVRGAARHCRPLTSGVMAEPTSWSLPCGSSRPHRLCSSRRRHSRAKPRPRVLVQTPKATGFSCSPSFSPPGGKEYTKYRLTHKLSCDMLLDEEKCASPFSKNP